MKSIWEDSKLKPYTEDKITQEEAGVGYVFTTSRWPRLDVTPAQHQETEHVICGNDVFSLCSRLKIELNLFFSSLSRCRNIFWAFRMIKGVFISGRAMRF